MTGCASGELTVVHLITDLNIGGAETMLSRLVDRLEGRGVHNIIVSLTSGGTLAEGLRRRGFEVMELDMRRGRLGLSASWRFFRLLRTRRPDVLQTWLYHADLLGLLFGPLAGVKTVVWGLRCAELDWREHPHTLRWVVRLLARMSRLPAAVIANSEAGRIAHERLGYEPRRWLVIPNGFPIPAEDFSRATRASLCDELGVPVESPLVGLIARLHPMKDHATFLRAAAIVARAVPQTHFVLAGRDVPGSRELRDQIKALQLQHCVHLLPERHDVPRLLTAVDIAVSSSYSEAFPNIVGEALACGTLTIATDAGDSAALVGDARWVVPVRDPNALAAAIADGLALAPDERRAIGERGRDRIMNLYSIERAAERFRDVYVALRKRRATSPMPCAG